VDTLSADHALRDLTLDLASAQPDKTGEEETLERVGTKFPTSAIAVTVFTGGWLAVAL